MPLTHRSREVRSTDTRKPGFIGIEIIIITRSPSFQGLPGRIFKKIHGKKMRETC
jgi:hypothetical protein